MTKTTITINGRTYDAITGMPVPNHVAHPPHTAPGRHAPQQHLRAFTDVSPATRAADVRKPERPATIDRGTHPAAQAIHQATERSHTLYRKALKKPAAESIGRAPQPQQHHTTTPAHSRSPLISRFAAEKPATDEPTTPPPHEPDQEPPIAPATVHPSVAKALAHQAAHTAEPAPQPTGTALKEALIKERLAEVEQAPAKTQKHGRRPSRMIAVLSSTLALLVLGGYLTYLTLPSISLRVAASRAGVNANMPEYKPDGYSLDGPITYSPGEVIINYKSNTNASTTYKLTQKATNWDSQAVLDNYVTKVTDNYLTFQERGVTVYTFNNKAAWVNGGLLYTLDGNAGLSSDQILRIATSM